MRAWVRKSYVYRRYTASRKGRRRRYNNAILYARRRYFHSGKSTRVYSHPRPPPRRPKGSPSRPPSLPVVGWRRKSSGIAAATAGCRVRSAAAGSTNATTNQASRPSRTSNPGRVSVRVCARAHPRVSPSVFVGACVCVCVCIPRIRRRFVARVAGSSVYNVAFANPCRHTHLSSYVYSLSVFRTCFHAGNYAHRVTCRFIIIGYRSDRT